MGRGNWLPHPPHERNWKMIYVELPIYIHFDENEEEIEDSSEWAYEDFCNDLSLILPKSFIINNPKKWVNWDRDVVIFAENDLMQILLADNQNTLAVTFLIKEDAPNYANSKLEQTYNKVAYELWKIYDLSIRSGPWTSSRWILPNEFRKVRVWDDGGKSNDRYTVMIRENDMDMIYGMNQIPFDPSGGFSQFVGENYKPNSNWGKEIRLIDLSEDVLKAIKQRME